MSDSEDYVANDSDSDYDEQDAAADDSDYKEEDDRDQQPRRGKRGSGAAAASRPAPSSGRGKRKTEAADPSSDRGAPKRARGAAGAPKLKDAVRSATKEQLETLLLQLAKEFELTDRIIEMLPPPDVEKVMADVCKLERKMRSSFPNVRWGSNDDKYAYNRVKGNLASYKQELLKYVREYAACKQYSTLKTYLMFAAQQVAHMPLFNGESMNAHIRQGAETVARTVAKHAAQLQLRSAECHELRECLRQLQRKYEGKDKACLQAALAVLDGISPAAAAAAVKEEEEEGQGGNLLVVY